MPRSLILSFCWSLGIKLRGTTETAPENSMEIETAWNGAKQKLLHQSQLFSTEVYLIYAG